MRRGLLFITLTAGRVGNVSGFDFEPVKPLDVKSVDPAMLAGVYGARAISGKSGKRRCRINLLKEFGIGGYQVEVAPGCE
jgi:hypothetical protein